jgi:hypothetical protein
MTMGRRRSITEKDLFDVMFLLNPTDAMIFGGSQLPKCTQCWKRRHAGQHTNY